MAVSRVQQGQATYDLTCASTRRSEGQPRRRARHAGHHGRRCPAAALGLADIRNDRAPYSITRENVQRKMVVMANVAGRDLASVVDDIRRRVAAEVQAAGGLPRRVRRPVRERRGGRSDLLFLGMGVTVGIFLLLFVAFHTCPRRAAGDAQPAAGHHRRRHRRLRRRRRAVGGVDHRLHHAVRHRHPQRRDDDRPHPSSGRARGRAAMPPRPSGAAPRSAWCRS
jgi:hypothetical protein